MIMMFLSVLSCWQRLGEDGVEQIPDADDGRADDADVDGEQRGA
jgi:hypothetical protein